MPDSGGQLSFDHDHRFIGIVEIDIGFQTLSNTTRYSAHIGHLLECSSIASLCRPFLLLIMHHNLPCMQDFSLKPGLGFRRQGGK